MGGFKSGPGTLGIGTTGTTVTVPVTVVGDGGSYSGKEPNRKGEKMEVWDDPVLPVEGSGSNRLPHSGLACAGSSKIHETPNRYADAQPGWLQTLARRDSGPRGGLGGKIAAPTPFNNQQQLKPPII